MRLLLVEDDFLIVSAAETSLRRAGHEVVGIASNAATAFEMARQRNPEFCIVDVNLSDGATGVLFAIELHRAFGVRSLFATSDALRCRNAWPAALGCLVKPYGIGDLPRAVAACDAVLHGRSVTCAPPTLELFEGES